MISLSLTISLLSVTVLALQDSDWKKENFTGAVPERIMRSKNGNIELVNILGSRLWKHGGCVFRIAFSPDGKRALSGSSDNRLKLWDVESGKEIDSIVSPSYKVPFLSEASSLSPL